MSVFWPIDIYEMHRKTVDTHLPELPKKEIKRHIHGGKTYRGIYRDAKFGHPSGTIKLTDADSRKVEKLTKVADSSESFVKGQTQAIFERARDSLRTDVEMKEDDKGSNAEGPIEAGILHKKGCFKLIKRISSGLADESDESSGDWIGTIARGPNNAKSAKKKKKKEKEASSDSGEPHCHPEGQGWQGARRSQTPQKLTPAIEELNSTIEQRASQGSF